MAYQRIKIDPWLRAYRLHHGMTQRAVAEAAKASVATVTRAERGNSLSFRLAADLAGVFGIEPEALLTNAGPKLPRAMRDEAGKRVVSVNACVFQIDRWLRPLLYKRRETLVNLAKRSGVSRTIVADAHRGAMVNFGTARALARAFGRDVEWIRRSGGEMELVMFEGIRPDFECSKCGDEVFGKEPIHCRKCGGMDFRRTGGGRSEIKPIDRLLAGIGRIQTEAKDIQAALRGSGHRRGPLIMAEIRSIETAAGKALRLATVVEPFRPIGSGKIKR